MQKKQVKLPNSAYQIYQNHRDQSLYPLMLSAFLLSSNSQFECNRAVRMLRDWLSDYKVMNQIAKHKYQNHISKILKNLYTLFQNQADVQICMAPYYYYFHNQWPQLTELIAKNLSQDAQKQYQFNLMLSEKFQQSLLQFNNPDEMTFKPLLQTVRMINIQKAKKQFIDNAENWCQKMLKLFDVCEIQNLKIQTLIEIIGCRSFLVVKQESHHFWSQMVDIFFIHIEKRLPSFMLTNQVDLKLLDWMLVIMNFQQIQKFLIKNKKRFLKTMISKMKQSPDPKNAFHYEKYYQLRKRLINMFFFVNKQESLKQIQDILTQFNRKSLSVLKDNEENIMFFDSMCEQKLPISKNNITEIIRSLSNAPSRKNLPVSVLIILVRVLHAASEQQIGEENIVSIIKSLSECIASKIGDPRIFELKIEISKFFITLATKYTWADQKSTQIMLMWCQQFERNNQVSTPQTIILLRILTKKHKSIVMTSFGHKLQFLVSDITYKMKCNKVFSNVSIFVSLLMSLYIDIGWNQSHKFIRQICTDKTEDLTFLYLYQSQILTRYQANGEKSAKLSDRELQQLKFILQTKQMWRISSRVNVYLYCIEIFFKKISQQEASLILKQLDNIILDLFTQMNQQCLYPHMIHLAARIFFKVGNYTQLCKLKSYEYFQAESFDILSKSFQKHTIILMTYMYSHLLNKADDLENFFVKLNQNKFLNSLFQGCNQFIGKSPRFYQQECYIILLAMKAKQSKIICSHSSLILFKQIQKNIVWWQQAQRCVSFKLPFQEESIKSESLLIQEFKQYYEENVRDYFKEQIEALLLGKRKHYLNDSQVEEQNQQL